MDITAFQSQFESGEQQDEVAIGELVVCTGSACGQSIVQVSDRVFNVFVGTKLADFGVPLSVLGSLTIKDDRMAARMLPGDQVVVDTTDSHIPIEGGVFAVLVEEAIHCRRLTQLAHGSVRLEHLNESYGDLDATLSEAQVASMLIVGRVKLLQGKL